MNYHALRTNRWFDFEKSKVYSVSIVFLQKSNDFIKTEQNVASNENELLPHCIKYDGFP